MTKKNSPMKIRPLQKKDWPSVRHIYQEGIDTGFATFETEVPDWETWNAKFLPTCRLVLEHENKILGWAVLSAASKRYVYRGVAEVTIYRDLKHPRKGIGSALMAALILSMVFLSVFGIISETEYFGVSPSFMAEGLNT